MRNGLEIGEKYLSGKVMGDIDTALFANKNKKSQYSPDLQGNGIDAWKTGQDLIVKLFGGQITLLARKNHNKKSQNSPDYLGNGIALWIREKKPPQQRENTTQKQKIPEQTVQPNVL